MPTPGILGSLSHAGTASWQTEDRFFGPYRPPNSTMSQQLEGNVPNGLDPPLVVKQRPSTSIDRIPPSSPSALAASKKHVGAVDESIQISSGGGEPRRILPQAAPSARLPMTVHPESRPSSYVGGVWGSPSLRRLSTSPSLSSAPECQSEAHSEVSSVTSRNSPQIQAVAKISIGAELYIYESRFLKAPSRQKSHCRVDPHTRTFYWHSRTLGSMVVVQKRDLLSAEHSCSA